jgi:hypothetical protein
MKLLAYTIGGQKIGVDILSWDTTMLGGNAPFIAIADTGSTPANYTNVSSVTMWDTYGSLAGLTEVQKKAEIIKLIPNTPTADQYLVLEKYMNVGIDSMTKIGTTTILGSTLTSSTALTGVTDIKMASTGSTIADLVVNSISGESGTYWGDLRIEGKLWVETIRRVKQEANLLQIRVNQDSGLLPLAIAGMEIFNPTGATTGVTVPSYILGVNGSGVLVAGWQGDTQPVAVGGAVVTTLHTNATGNITTTSTTAVLMTGMQFTNVPSGTYLVSFGTSLSHSTSTVPITTSIYAGGALVANSELTFQRGTQAVTANHGYSNFRITLATAQDVEIRWRTTSGTATANTGRYMTLLKVL